MSFYDSNIIESNREEIKKYQNKIKFERKSYFDNEIVERGVLAILKNGCDFIHSLTSLAADSANADLCVLSPFIPKGQNISDA